VADVTDSSYSYDSSDSLVVTGATVVIDRGDSDSNDIGRGSNSDSSNRDDSSDNIANDCSDSSEQ